MHDDYGLQIGNNSEGRSMKFEMEIARRRISVLL